MSKKKIYVEGLGLVEGHFSGIGHYILGIFRGLDEIIEKEKLNQNDVPDVRVVIPYNSLGKFQSFGFKHLKPKLVPISFKYMSGLWHRGLMPPLDLFCGRGLYIFTRFVSMRLLFSKSTTIIYDLSYELHKEFSDDKNAEFLSKGVQRTLKQVADVFTISENAKREIVDFYGVDKSKVHVATPAVDQRYFYKRDPEQIETVRRKYNLDSNYILALSNLEPRKNLETLVDAYCALPKKYTDKTSLLLVGVSGWKTDRLFEKIVAKVEQGYNIIRPSDYVDDTDMPAVISGASMLVYPSYYEGFGIPPLEALACGVPVITADNSSLPEVVEGAGTMLDCRDTKGFTKQIKRHLDNKRSIEKELSKAGPARADLFSWRESARVYWDYAKEQLQ